MKTRALALTIFMLFAPRGTNAGTETATSTGSATSAATSLPDQTTFNDIGFLDPELVENANPRVLAEMIVKRLSNGCDSKRDPSRAPPKNPKNDDIVMMLPDRVLDSVNKYGFKNQHQTGSTGGCPCKDQRIDSEMRETQLGVPYTNKMRDLLPKYALNVFWDDKHGDVFLPEDYGNVMVKFKPDVKRRATWTYQNSLNMGLTARTHYIGEIPGQRCESYCESQIWGPLDMTDVDSIRIPEGMAITESMKALNVPIYTYKKEDQNGSYQQRRYQQQYGSQSGSQHGSQNSPLPRTGALMGVTFGKNPIYTPTGVPSPAQDFSEDAAKESLQKATNSAEKSILNNQVLGHMTSDEIVQKYKTLVPDPPPPDPDGPPGGAPGPGPSGYGSGGNNSINPYPNSINPYPNGGYIGRNRNSSEGSINDEANRLLAELAGRKKTPQEIEFLKSVAATNSSNARGLLALTGLMSQPWNDVKPLLLKHTNSGMNSYYGGSYDSVWKYLLAHFNKQHPNDPDLQKLINEPRTNMYQRAGGGNGDELYGSCTADKNSNPND